MESQGFIEMSREFFEAILKPSSNYLWLATIVGLGLLVFGYRRLWCPPSSKSPFEQTEEGFQPLSFGRFAQDLIFRILSTGPVLSVLALGLCCLYFQGQYDAAQASFQEKLRIQNDGVQPMIDRLKKENAHLDDRDARYIEQERNARTELAFANVMLESHPRGCFIIKNAVVFQLVDGYTESGEIIWSKRAVVLHANSWKGLVRHEFNLTDLCEEEEFSSSEVFPLGRLTDKLSVGKGRVARNLSILNIPVTSMEAVMEKKDGRYVLNLDLTKVPFKKGWGTTMLFTAKFPVR